MSVAWTTIAIIVLLLPGVFFFIGVATYERLSREIIRSGVVSELAAATVIAATLHTVAIVALSMFGFRLSEFIKPLAEYDQITSAQLWSRIADRLLEVTLYLLVMAGVGLGLGRLVALGVLKGRLRFLAMHKWVYDIVAAGRRGGIVTAWVMTTVIEDNRALMYKGVVHEIFLTNDGKISYVVLTNCSKFYMTFGADGLAATEQLKLFDIADEGRIWDYLQIEGSNIANILFEPSSQTIKATKQGTEALLAELRKVQQIQRENLQQLRREQRLRPQGSQRGGRDSG
jgi:hypothetical protein